VNLVLHAYSLPRKRLTSDQAVELLTGFARALLDQTGFSVVPPLTAAPWLRRWLMRSGDCVELNRGRQQPRERGPRPAAPLTLPGRVLVLQPRAAAGGSVRSGRATKKKNVKNPQASQFFPTTSAFKSK